MPLRVHFDAGNEADIPQQRVLQLRQPIFRIVCVKPSSIIICSQ